MKPREDGFEKNRIPKTPNNIFIKGKVESACRQDWKVGAAVVANQDLCQRGQGRKSREEKPKYV